MDDVKMMKMTSNSPTTQRRVLSGAARKQPPGGFSSSGGVFQNDLAMVQRGSPRNSAGSSRSKQASAIGGYGNIFQNDVQMVVGGGDGRQAASRTPTAPWNAAHGRTASPVPVRRNVGPRHSQPGAAGLNTGMVRLAAAAPSPTPSQQQQPAAPPQPTAAEIRATEKAAFLAERKEQLAMAKAKQLRLSNVANAASALAGERLAGLLAKAARQEELEDATAAAASENVKPTRDATPFAGHLKGSRPKRTVGRGAPRCAAAAPKADGRQRRAVSAKSTAEERKAAAARSRTKARTKAKLDAERMANSATKGIRLQKKHRNSSRVLAPPGGKSSISFN